MTTAGTVIRPMRADDVEEAADLLHRHDFGDRLDFFRWALTRPTLAPFVAAAPGGIVATGIAAAHASTGWVGAIFVVPAERGTGLGRRMTATVLEELEQRGARTQILIASPMGQPMYERLGFRVLDRQVRFSIDGLPSNDGAAGADRGIRSFRADDAGAIAALDRSATGEDRRAVLEALVAPASTLVAVDGADRVRGYLVRTPWRGGALIARDPADALRLLERRRRSTGASGRAGAGLLASNTAGRDLLRNAGWHEEIGNVRMVRGEPLDWHPNAIYGQLNGALG